MRGRLGQPPAPPPRLPHSEPHFLRKQNQEPRRHVLARPHLARRAGDAVTSFLCGRTRPVPGTAVAVLGAGGFLATPPTPVGGSLFRTMVPLLQERPPEGGDLGGVAFAHLPCPLLLSAPPNLGRPRPSFPAHLCLVRPCSRCLGVRPPPSAPGAPPIHFLSTKRPCVSSPRLSQKRNLGPLQPRPRRPRSCSQHRPRGHRRGLAQGSWPRTATPCPPPRSRAPQGVPHHLSPAHARSPCVDSGVRACPKAPGSLQGTRRVLVSS